MSQGIVSCGMTVRATNDLQTTNCEFQTKQGFSEVIEGDVNSVEVMAALHAAHGSPVLLSGGFSCQPWSALGDKAGMRDPRSRSLIGTLRTGYFLRAFAIQLECVVEASRDEEVRAVINEYCQLTHFRQSEITLSLETIMPTKRNRWWCMLTNATLPKLQLTPLPCLSRPPVLGDVIPVCPAWPSKHMQQLELDQYETRKFAEFGGLDQNMVKHNGVVRTALHGSANQLTPCPCQCRKYPMSEERLKAKGMFGALVRIAGEYSTTMGQLPKTRHLHPWEMCVIHGGIPEYDWYPMRYSIAALGQMASPVQSCWVTGHLLAACDIAMDQPVRLPEEHLWNHFCRFAQAIATTQPQVHGTEGFQQYMQEVRGNLLAKVVMAKGPQCTEVRFDSEKNEENSQRSGRKNLPLEFPIGDNKQPAAKTQALVKENKQPGNRAQEPATKSAEEAPKLHPPMIFQAMPSDALVTVGPTPRPMNASFQCDQPEVQGKGLMRITHSEIAYLPSCSPASAVKPDRHTGGIGAFASHAHGAPTKAEPQAKVAGDKSVDMYKANEIANARAPVADGQCPEPTERAHGQLKRKMPDSANGKVDHAEDVKALKPAPRSIEHARQDENSPRDASEPMPMTTNTTASDMHPPAPVPDRNASFPQPVGDAEVVNTEEHAHLQPTQLSQLPNDAHVKGGLVSNSREGEPAIVDNQLAQEGDGLTQEMLTTVEALDSGSNQDKTDNMHVVQVIRQDDNIPTYVSIHKETTVGAITVAEAKMGSLIPPICVNTSVGTRILSAATTTPYQQVFLKEMARYGSGRTRDEITMPIELIELDAITRLALLYRQEAFVADDEMNYYLSMLTATGQAIQAPIAIIPDEYKDEELELILKDWFAKAMIVAEAPCTIITSIYAHHHWFPVGMKFHHGHVQVHTTPGGADWVHIAIRDMDKACTLHTTEIASSFPNDCGFQSIGWVMSFVFDPSHHQSHAKPIMPCTAIAWRGMFEHYIIAQGLANRVVSPTQFKFGGVNGGDVANSLQELLLEHGVPKDQVGDRASVIVDKLGRSTVARTMRGSQPWRELKQIANQCSPKLQLVLASELQEVIRKRTEQTQKFGSKQTKKKHSFQPKAPIQIQADDIGIPDGIFQDASGHAIHQKALANIGPEASGIIVVHAQQAVPYLKFTQPVSKQGLALLVLDHMNPLMHGVGEEIRFPARFEKTSEPILISAKLVQLGASLVSRIVPDQALKVDEVHTQVVRVVMFRDEIDKKWEAILDKPVKYLVSVVKMLQPNHEGTSTIMDVWDRQWLNDEMERTKPADASLFMASFRLECTDIVDALKESGSAGCYLEPRSPDGRSPAAEYRVIWLNKHDKQSAMIASQSTSQWTCIVRSGGRFGLRVSVQDAQKVHEQHKPMTPFLTSDQVMTFHVGPIPHGSNRSALTKLFQSWSWQARPCQPKGRTPDGKGVVWECQAICKPPYEVYQLEHADVLITEVPRKNQRPSMPMPSIQASAKTMAALKASDAVETASQDPWEINDPWGNYQTPIKITKKSGATEVNCHDDIDLLAAKVQRKLQSSWPQQSGSKMEVDPDTSDISRIQTMEDRLSKLEHTVQSNHVQQGKHVQELASQIAQVQHNVDQQGKAFQAHLDDKLDKQLQQIEHLLSKRSRTE